MTPQIAPQTLFNGLAGIGLDYLKGSKPPSEFEVRRFEKEIEALARPDPSGYLELRGFLAAIRGNDDDVDSYFERALVLSRRRIGPITRYLAVLASTTRTEAVLAQFRKYRDDIRTDVDALRHAQATLTYTGWFVTANAIGAELARRGLAVGDFLVTGDAERFLREDEVAHAVGFAHRFLNARGARARMVQATHVPHETGDSTLLYQLGVDGAPDEVAELEWDLFGALDEAAIPAEQQGRLRIALATWDKHRGDHGRHAA